MEVVCYFPFAKSERCKENTKYTHNTTTTHHRFR